MGVNDIETIVEDASNKTPQFIETYALNKQDIEFYNKLLRLKGSTIYRKYGLKRDERPCALAITFSNGYCMDIDLIICAEDKPFINVVLFDAAGMEVNCDTGDEQIEGEYQLSGETGDYIVRIVANNA